MLKIFMPMFFIMMFSPVWHIICVFLMLSLTLLTHKMFFSLILSSAMSMTLMLDTMSMSLSLLALWVTMMMYLASYLLKILEKNTFKFNILTMSLLMILSLCFMMNNMLMFYMLFEMSLIPTMMIIVGWGYQPERIKASMYLMMYTVSASLPLLMILTYMYNKVSSLFLLFPSYINLSITTSLMLSLAFLTKMPMYLTHLWLPKAHVEAPVAGSMVLAGVLLKLGSYGLMRVLMISPLMLNSMFYMLMTISLWGTLISSIICIRQHDMKALIAYSSVSHMALVIMGILVMMKFGWEGAVIMMVAHGLSSSGLFFMTNMSYEFSNTRSIFLTKGYLSMAPTITLWWFLMSIANMGAPPTINIISEILLLTSVLSLSILSSLLILPTLLLSMLYSLLLFTAIAHGPPSTFSLSHLPFVTRNSITALAHIIPLFTMFLTTTLFTSFLL